MVRETSFYKTFFSMAAVVLCLNSDQLFKGVPIFFKVNFGKWAKALTREA